MPGIWHHGCCCCPCTGYTLAATATLTATACTPEVYCESCENTYTELNDFTTQKHNGEKFCVWSGEAWDGDIWVALYLVYAPRRGKWYARTQDAFSPFAHFGGAVDLGWWDQFYEIQEAITCGEDGDLSGTFDLPGIDAPAAHNCEGCTLTVTLT